MHIDSGSVVAVFAVIGFLFAGVAVFGQWKVSKNTTALTQYRETAQAWEGKARAQETEITDLRHEVAELQVQMTEKGKENAELTGRVSVLQDALTGKASWDILESRIGEALSIAGETRTEVRAIHEMLIGKGPS
jgi:predicted RNase H-like nuclease (RuvC/YqgF family)